MHKSPLPHIPRITTIIIIPIIPILINIALNTILLDPQTSNFQSSNIIPHLILLGLQNAAQGSADTVEGGAHSPARDDLGVMRLEDEE